MLSVNSLLDSIHGGSGHEGMVPLDQQYQLFASTGAIKFPTPDSEAWKEKVLVKEINMSLSPQLNLFVHLYLFDCSDISFVQIKRLYLLLTVKESAMDVPSNLEARRRISFFSNSLFMDMPSAPKIRNMLSFS